jgi:glycopeptide antibiotics resistance protein
VVSWMYRMVWESIWIFSFMVPVLWMWQTVFAGKYTPKTHRIGLWLFAFYVAGLVAVTGVFQLLFMKPVFAPYFNFELFIDIFACPMQYLLNFFLFVPMGFLVPLLWKQYRTENHVLLFGFGTSFAIEVLQMFCGRTTDVDDLLMNTLGALIGYWMFLVAERQTSFCLLRRNKTAEAGVAVSRAFQTLAYEN